MENNFIQMVASAGHLVAYTMDPIFKHIIDCVQLYLTNGFTCSCSLTVTVSSYSFSKKNGPIMPLDKCLRAGFLCPKCDNFSCLHTCQDQNELHLKRWFFLPISASSASRSQAHFPVLFNYATGQKSHQTVTRFVCVCFSKYACGLMRQFFLFTYLPRSKWASSEKMIFFANIGIFCKSIAGPLNEAYTSV